MSFLASTHMLPDSRLAVLRRGGHDGGMHHTAGVVELELMEHRASRRLGKARASAPAHLSNGTGMLSPSNGRLGSASLRHMRATSQRVEHLHRLSDVCKNGLRSGGRRPALAAATFASCDSAPHDALIRASAPVK